MKFNTVNTKAEQLKNGYFKTGSGNELILIIGSCRCVAYLNYFHENNKNNRFTICFIDPFNYNFDASDNRVDMEVIITSLEQNENILSLLRSTTIFIHEFYKNFGMFNCSRESEKNIYQFGMNASIDICVPSFNDCFILAQDIVNFDTDIRRKAMQDYNVIGKLSAQTEAQIIEISNTNLEKFYKVCRLSDIPQMEGHVKVYLDTVRFFWTSNHVSKAFTLAVFNYINQYWFNGSLTVDPNHDDMFANNYTHLTQYDSFEWGEERKKLVI